MYLSMSARSTELAPAFFATAEETTVSSGFWAFQMSGRRVFTHSILYIVWQFGQNAAIFEICDPQPSQALSGDWSFVIVIQSGWALTRRSRHNSFAEFVKSAP